ncbi:MAG: hypothetical protein KAU50_06685 [Candidatus Marinimicrobia bacterium]|nr:hypothetical protein [Candidatus Neomarinimicrobiota bacterium]
MSIEPINLANPLEKINLAEAKKRLSLNRFSQNDIARVAVVRIRQYGIKGLTQVTVSRVLSGQLTEGPYFQAIKWAIEVILVVNLDLQSNGDVHHE